MKNVCAFCWLLTFNLLLLLSWDNYLYKRRKKSKIKREKRYYISAVCATFFGCHRWFARRPTQIYLWWRWWWWKLNCSEIGTKKKSQTRIEECVLNTLKLNQIKWNCQKNQDHTLFRAMSFFFFQNDIQLFRLFYLDQYIKHFRHYLKIFHCWRRLGSFFLYSYMFHIHSSSSAGVSNSIFSFASSQQL